jgi:hypothetical protein
MDRDKLEYIEFVVGGVVALLFAIAGIASGYGSVGLGAGLIYGLILAIVGYVIGMFIGKIVWGLADIFLFAIWKKDFWQWFALLAGLALVLFVVIWGWAWK